MILRVIIRGAARAEFESDAEYYEQRRTGLGREFVSEIHDAISSAALHPERFPAVRGVVRRIGARRFPYSVLYRVRGTTFEVLAIFHSSRNPIIWQRRI